MQLASPYYEQVCKGYKSVEGRLNTGKWEKVKIGQLFAIFPAKKDSETNDSKTETKSIYFLAHVTNVCKYENFHKLYDVYGTRLLPDTRVEDEPWKIYDEWYDPKLVAEHGVVGITLDVIWVLEDETE